jgi:hypothetical protein
MASGFLVKSLDQGKKEKKKERDSCVFDEEHLQTKSESILVTGIHGAAVSLVAFL